MTTTTTMMMVADGSAMPSPSSSALHDAITHPPSLGRRTWHSAQNTPRTLTPTPANTTQQRSGTLLPKQKKTESIHTARFPYPFLRQPFDKVPTFRFTRKHHRHTRDELPTHRLSPRIFGGRPAVRRTSTRAIYLALCPIGRRMHPSRGGGRQAMPACCTLCTLNGKDMVYGLFFFFFFSFGIWPKKGRFVE